MNLGGIPLAENRYGFRGMMLPPAGFARLAGWRARERRKER